MAYFSSSFLLDFAYLLLLIFCGVYLWYQKHFKYWEKQNVKFSKPSIPLGNLGGVNVTVSISELMQDLYNAGTGNKVFGMFYMFKPGLLIRDPELIKYVLVKDFNHFHDHGLYSCKESDPLSSHLFNTNGLEWRNLRMQLTPTFTSGKMKMMFPSILKCAGKLKECLNELALVNEVTEVKELMARFTTDVITLCAFGIETNTVQNENEIFREMGRKTFEPTIELATRNCVSYFFPGLAALIKLRVIPKEVTAFFTSIFEETVNFRQSNNIQQKDFLQLLLQLMEKGYISEKDPSLASNDKDEVKKFKKLTVLEAAAQAFVFFIAGFETSSTSLHFALYELAMNPEIQETAAIEIQTVLKRHGGILTYDNVLEMEYLEKVIAETLRKYPPLGVIIRSCTKAYRLPGTELLVEEGMRVTVPTLGLHRDPNYYPEPEKFDPERFSEENKAGRSPYVYLPFGIGPRHCIGSRFAMMQMKVALIQLLEHYKVEPCEQTQIPLKLDPKQGVVSAAGGVHLKISLRS